jgi:hypothetical protein
MTSCTRLVPTAFILVLAAASAAPGADLARERRIAPRLTDAPGLTPGLPGFRVPRLVVGPLAFEPLDPCLQCDVIYSVDGSGRTYAIDPEAGTSTFVGISSGFFDIGATADGRLFGVTSGGSLQPISTCDATVEPPLGGSGAFTNGLGGELGDPVLLGQGPPLVDFDLSAGFSSSVRGGSIGGAPPAWCGGSAGDLAFDPTDGTLYSTLACPACLGDMLVILDPATGDVLSEVGCLVDALGAPIVATFGIAFDSCGDFWAGQGGSSSLFRIDPATAMGVAVPIAGGYSGTNGLASVPCAAVGGGCAPRTQGFWKRQCTADHPSGEPGRLASYLAEIAGTATFSDVGTVAEACAELTPSPRMDKCEQAEAQLAALLFNVASNRLSSCCCVEGPDGDITASDAIGIIDALLANPLRDFGDCVTAQALAAAINEGDARCDE